MAENKYYWLKLKRDCCKGHDMRIIEEMPNGKDYILFYLKMLLESIDHNGELRFNDTIPYNEQMLSVITNTNIDIVRAAMKVFIQLGMIEIYDDETIYMREMQSMIGSESASAARMRKMRSQKVLASHCDSNVQKSDIEIEIDIEKDKELDKEKDKRSAKPTRHKYGEYKNVLLSDEDMEKLKAEFPDDWQQRIERLSGYIASTGKSYKNHLATIRNWAKRDKEKGAAEKKQKNDGWCMPNADDDIDLTKIFG